GPPAAEGKRTRTYRVRVEDFTVHMLGHDSESERVEQCTARRVQVDEQFAVTDDLDLVYDFELVMEGRCKLFVTYRIRCVRDGTVGQWLPMLAKLAFAEAEGNCLRLGKIPLFRQVIVQLPVRAEFDEGAVNERSNPLILNTGPPPRIQILGFRV